MNKLRKALELKEKGKVSKLVLIKGRYLETQPDLLFPNELDRVFCLGVDWGEILENKAKGKMELVHDFFKEQYKLVMQAYNFQKPLMSLMNGTVANSGAGLAFACGMRLSTVHTIFACPETSFGFIPDCGQTFHLSRLEKHLGVYLSLTGRRVRGFDLKHLGLATHQIIAGTESEMAEMVGNAWTGDYRGFLPLMELYECSPAPFSLGEHVDLIDRCFGKESVEEIMESLEKEGTSFAMKTAQMLRERSPLSLKLALAAQRKVMEEKLDLRETMHYEWRAVKRLLDDSHSDLYTGLEETILKGRFVPKSSIRWKSSLQTVSEKQVEEYFAPFQDPMEEQFVQDIESVSLFFFQKKKEWERKKMMITNRPEMNLCDYT